MRIIYVLVMLLSYQYCLAQNTVTDSSTTIYPYFKKGEKKAFQVKETYTQFAGGFVSMKASALYETAMEVVEDSANHYTVEWSIHTTSAEDNKFGVYTLIANMRNGLTVRYKLNKQGIPIELLNLPEVMTHLQQAFDSLSFGREYDPINRALVNQLPAFLNTVGGIVDVYLKPLFLYHAPYGGTWVLKKPNYRANDAANAYGGESIPTVVIVELDKLEPQKDFAQLTIDQIVNKELAAKILAGKLKEIAEDAMVRTIKKGELPDQIKMKDRNEFDVLLSSGWLSRAFYERITKDGLSKKVDHMEITLKQP